MKNLDFNLDLYEINIASALENRPVEIDFVLPGLPLGQVGIMSAQGGVGKSFFCLTLVSQLCSVNHCDFDIGIAISKANKSNKVIYISLEDDRTILTHRLWSIQNHWSTSLDNLTFMKAFAENLHIFSLSGLGLALINETAEPTAVYTSILSKAKVIKPRLIIIDTLRRSHEGEENSNGIMTKVLRHFEYMAREANAAVLLLHHENKSSSELGLYSSRGASAIVDTVRYLIRLQVMSKLEAIARNIGLSERRLWVYLSIEKSNYSAVCSGFWLYRSEHGVLVRKDPPVKMNRNQQEKVISYGWR